MKRTVIVGMSGGVDSTVAAYLLKEQGYDVIGITLLTWREKTCGQKAQGLNGEKFYEDKAVADAKRAAEVLGIPHDVMDVGAEFKHCVVDYFVEEYLQGRTPNPCIACNRHIKWEALLKRGRELGAEYLATGHYAKIRLLGNGRYTLVNSATVQKDQTYALYALTQEQLARTLLPLGDHTKEEVRAIAKKAGLFVADKPDSQEICFVPDDDYAAFIDREAKERVPGAGNFVTADGQILGTHKGITHYTVGQRRGLELPMGRRVFVSQIRPQTNEVVIGEGDEVFSDTVLCDRVNYMAVADLKEPKRVFAKIRYHHKGEYCRIEKEPDGKVRCFFEKPVRAATPGQAVVFYEDGHVLGGGIIL